MSNALTDVRVDHVRFYVSDVRASVDQLCRGYGLTVYAVSGPKDAKATSVALSSGDIRFVMTEAKVDDHPGTSFVNAHGDGVADIALRTPNAREAFETSVSRGARPVSPPEVRDGVTTARIVGFGDVVHTFVERVPEMDAARLPGLRSEPATTVGEATGILAVDHVAVCLEAGQLEPTVTFYCDVLDFRVIFTEHIVVGAQAMNSTVVQSGSGGVTLTLIEPDLSREPGQIDQFVKSHAGAGVQHIAFSSENIVQTIDLLRGRGVEFLSAPAAYYRLLVERLELDRHSVGELKRLDLLADEDHDGQLFQVFARSTHPRRTFFLEVIERLGATTFGSGNIRALYEAVEQERDR